MSAYAETSAYADTADVQERMKRKLSTEEADVCEVLLSDAAVMIDALAPKAAEQAKKLVSCRMVIRALGDGGDDVIPMGATQGSMSALGYSQSWTLGSGGGTGELYIGKAERQLLGIGNRIGSRSPTEDLAAEVIP